MKKHATQAKPNGIGVKKKLVNLCQRLLQRLRSTQLSTAAFYLFGVIVLVIFDLPQTFFIIKSNLLLWILIIPVTETFIAATMLVAQQISADSGAEMVRRPLWFCFVMLLATIFAYGVIGNYNKILLSVFGGGIIKVLQFRYALFLAPLGWLSCLYLQRAEDEAKFATLAIRRSMLGRDVAQSQLLAARSQINPVLVVRILNEIQALYESDANRASTLMDHLIGYLRLAMNRLRDKSPSFATESALIRSYFALREAESAVKVDFEMRFTGKGASQQDASPAPLFLVAQKMFEAGVCEGAKNLAMRVDVLENSVDIALGLGIAAMSDTALTCLTADLLEISDRSGDILHHLSDTQEHWYVISFPIESEIADGIDR